MGAVQLLSCLDCGGPQQHQREGKLAIVDTEDTALLEFLSILWQLALKGPPWLVLLYRSEQQVLKGQLWLGPFCVAHHSKHSEDIPGWGPSHCSMHQALKGLSPGSSLLGQPPEPACGEREATVMAPRTQSTQQECPTSAAACIRMDLRSCPGYVGPWSRLSGWLPFHSDCHRSAASLSGSLKCFPSVAADCPGSSSPHHLPHPVHISSIHSPSLSLLSFIRPDFVWICIFLSWKVVRDT